ncbi:MAG: hypothetical protein ABW185_20265 [Sedimenticola sp.]
MEKLIILGSELNRVMKVAEVNAVGRFDSCDMDGKGSRRRE